MRRMWWSLSFALLIGLPSTAPAEDALKVGDVRAAQARDGVALRDAAKALATVVRVLPYGTRVTVDALKSYYARVKLDDGTLGWVRSAEIVEPATLSGAGARGAVDPTAYSTADISAAGRQFDQKTENTFKTMDDKIGAAYAVVSALEKTTPPDAELALFLKEGWLGSHEELEPVLGPKATLHMVGGSGTLIPAIQGPGGWKPSGGGPASDAESVAQLESGTFSPEQEYFLGRSVAAAAIAEHGLDPDPARQAMVKRIGAAIVKVSDRARPTHGGYHFAVLDDSTPNGISGPGGFVFVTRGAIALARNEDEVAAILAHEIAHVSLKHGEKTIKKTRAWQEKVSQMKAISDEDLAKAARKAKECNLCAEFAKLLGGTAKSFVQTLDKEGYGKEFEFEADWEGGIYLCETGYRSSALAEYLAILPNREAATWTTHPSPVDRIDSLRPLIIRHCFPEDELKAGVEARNARFEAMEARRK